MRSDAATSAKRGSVAATACQAVANLRRSVVRSGVAARALIGIVAGACSVLAFAPFFCWPVLFVTLPVLVWLIDAAAPDSAAGGWPMSGWFRPALAGWSFGFGFFAAGLFWIGEAFLVEAEVFAWLVPFVVTLLPAGLALFFAAAAVVGARFWMPGLARVLVLALALSLAEWLRGHILTGFPWNVLGYALTSPLALMQSASLIGIYGLTIATVIIAASPLVMLADGDGGDGSSERLRTAVAIALLPLAVAYAWGAFRLHSDPGRKVDGVRLRLVQPSIVQTEKWKPEHQGRIFAEHLALSRTAPDGHEDGLAGITHVIWPEVAMPFLPLRQPEALAMIGRMLPPGVHLLAGALRVDDAHADPAQAWQVFNSLIAFGEGGRPVAIYDKNHLVPFGEYLPLKPVLALIGLRQLTQTRGGLASGPIPRPLLDVPGLPPVGALVCYEAIFPADIVQGTARPGILVNVTNDGWFGVTIGPHQHLHQARVRAVEEGIALARVANNGISAMVDPYGRVTGRLGLDQRGVIDTDLPAAIAPPLYARAGDRVFWLLWAALAVAMAYRRRFRP